MAATETFGPFDTAPFTDQTNWYRSAPAWAPSGVIDTPAASPSTGSLGITFSALTPTLSAGRAWVRGALYELAGGAKTLSAISTNTNASLDRRDRIVLRRDLSAKTVSLVALTGTPASSPAAPALAQDETGQWDLPLFSFLVPRGSGTTITGIIDERVFIDERGAYEDLGDAQGSDVNAGSSNTTTVSLAVNVPVGLTTGRKVKVTGTVFISTPAGVGAVVLLGSKSRTINQAFDGDVTVVLRDTDLTPGSRTYNLQVHSTVAGQSVTCRAPCLGAEIR